MAATKKSRSSGSKARRSSSARKSSSSSKPSSSKQSGISQTLDATPFTPGTKVEVHGGTPRGEVRGDSVTSATVTKDRKLNLKGLVPYAPYVLRGKVKVSDALPNGKTEDREETREVRFMAKPDSFQNTEPAQRSLRAHTSAVHEQHRLAAAEVASANAKK